MPPRPYEYIKRMVWPKARNIFSRIFMDETLKIGQQELTTQRFFLNPAGVTIDHEEWLNHVVKAILECKAGAFLDVGANVGQTMLKVVLFDRERQYVGFEPHAAGCLIIEQFIKSNRLSNYQILPVALGNKNGLAKLFTRGGDSSMAVSSSASFVEGFRPDSFYSSAKVIYVAKGDDIIQDLELSAISVIKIDVEGGEMEVVEGLRRSLDVYKPFILFEVLPHYLAITDEPLDEDMTAFRTKRIGRLEVILREAGYTIYQIWSKTQLRRVSHIDPGTTPGLSKADYLAVPTSEEDNFLRVFEALSAPTML